MKNYKDKVVWIVGASSGIGEALAKRLSKEGAKLILSARREDQLKEVLNNLDNSGHEIQALDVTDSKKADKISKEIHKKHGTIDSIIFMAATYSRDEDERNDVNKIKQVIDINITGAYNIVQPCLKIMKGIQKNNSNNESEIVICASVAGYRGLPQGQPYCSTKAALINYAESLYIENMDNNIDIKIICPGFVKTRITDKNDFKMPMIITTDVAAKHLVKGLKSDVFEIDFPKKFTLMMSFLKILPNKPYFWLANKIVNKI